jgi:3-hydroxyisobutyrate dehydrogenase-like beta-hydroxyacid dehydrogenase
MAGGTPEAFARAEPVMAAYGSRIVHMGPSGAGSATKLANQLLVGVHSAVAAEAIALILREGLDLKDALDLIGVSFGASRMLERNGNLVLSRSYEPGTSIDLIVKDLRLIKSQATVDGLALPMGAAAQELFEEAQAEGLGGKDLAGIFLRIEQVTGMRVGSDPA